MLIYGYMEGGQLVCTYLEDYTTNIVDANGLRKSRLCTAQEQAATLDAIWKPVDPINEAEMRPKNEYEVVYPVPYDAGDHIAYRYERTFDKQLIRAQIADLKAALSASDYKVAKCYEASLMKQTPPYNVETLHHERQAQRDRINELEEILQAKSDFNTITFN